MVVKVATFVVNVSAVVVKVTIGSQSENNYYKSKIIITQPVSTLSQPAFIIAYVLLEQGSITFAK